MLFDKKQTISASCGLFECVFLGYFSELPDSHILDRDIFFPGELTDDEQWDFLLMLLDNHIVDSDIFFLGELTDDV